MPGQFRETQDKMIEGIHLSYVIEFVRINAIDMGNVVIGLT